MASGLPKGRTALLAGRSLIEPIQPTDHFLPEQTACDPGIVALGGMPTQAPRVERIFPRVGLPTIFRHIVVFGPKDLSPLEVSSAWQSAERILAFVSGCMG
jgi:hypothetical protein